MPVLAQYPSKPIRLIVPFPPGGSNDIVGRLVGNELTGQAGPAGGDRQPRGRRRDHRNGNRRTRASDGHTLLIISVAYAYNPSIYKSNLKFDDKSFTPVAMLGTGPNALTVNPQLPVKSVKELIALAKAKPGTLNYASAGIGSFQHLSSEMFRIMAGVDIVHVPFKGGGPAMADVIAGSTQICIGSLLQVIPYVRSGRLRALATGGAKRVAGTVGRAHSSRSLAWPATKRTTGGASSRRLRRLAPSSSGCMLKPRRCSPRRTCRRSSKARAPKR
jgi:tripartite-type tricarboxylate transporter receptor subunit TctC